MAFLQDVAAFIYLFTCMLKNIQEAWIPKYECVCVCVCGLMWQVSITIN